MPLEVKEEEVKRTVDDLYYTGEIVEKKIDGVVFKLRPMLGLDYMDLVSEYTNLAEARLDRRGYTVELIRRCVVEPDIDPTKLDGRPLLLLVSTIESLHGGGIGDLTKK